MDRTKYTVVEPDGHAAFYTQHSGESIIVIGDHRAAAIFITFWML